MIVKKITTGFVIQEYDTETGKWNSQEFIASDSTEWEDEEGNAVDVWALKTEENIEIPYLSFDMVPPAYMDDGEVETCPECGTPLIKDGKECPNCGKFF